MKLNATVATYIYSIQPYWRMTKKTVNLPPQGGRRPERTIRVSIIKEALGEQKERSKGEEGEGGTR